MQRTELGKRSMDQVRAQVRDRIRSQLNHDG